MPFIFISSTENACNAVKSLRRFGCERFETAKLKLPAKPSSVQSQWGYTFMHSLVVHASIEWGTPIPLAWLLSFFFPAFRRHFMAIPIAGHRVHQNMSFVFI
jgi:hypothetical protein